MTLSPEGLRDQFLECSSRAPLHARYSNAVAIRNVAVLLAATTASIGDVWIFLGSWLKSKWNNRDKAGNGCNGSDAFSAPDGDQ